jgi:hypothetical protein
MGTYCHDIAQNAGKLHPMANRSQNRVNSSNRASVIIAGLVAFTGILTLSWQVYKDINKFAEIDKPNTIPTIQPQNSGSPKVEPNDKGNHQKSDLQAIKPASPEVKNEEKIEELPTISVKGIPPVVEKGINFELYNCKSVKGARRPFTCNFLVTNQNNSKKKVAIRTYESYAGRSLIIDGNGNVINASYAKLGDIASERAAETYLFPGAPIKLTVDFDAVPVNKLSRIVLICYLSGGGGGGFDVIFPIPQS